MKFLSVWNHLEDENDLKRQSVLIPLDRIVRVDLRANEDDHVWTNSDDDMTGSWYCKINGSFVESIIDF